MEIKVTHKGKATLVNTDNVLTVYYDNDIKQQKRLAKITFVNGSVVFIDESLEEYYEIVQSVRSGVKQVIDWTDAIPTVEQRMEESYNEFQPRNTYRPRQRYYNNRERNYNY